jgi:hypothetical protein
MAALNVIGSLNISGKYKINGEDVSMGGEKFDNKITGGLDF